jgi:hypothetical protein
VQANPKRCTRVAAAFKIKVILFSRAVATPILFFKHEQGPQDVKDRSVQIGAVVFSKKGGTSASRSCSIPRTVSNVFVFCSKAPIASSTQK